MAYKNVRPAAVALIILASLSSAQNASAQSLGLPQMLGEKTYTDLVSPQDYSSKEGANLKKGRPVSEGLPLQASGFGNLTPTSALQAAGIDVDFTQTQLGDLKFISKISLESLVKADPTLKNILAQSIGWTGQGEKTLGEIANIPELAKLPLPESVLKNNTVANFGEIASIPYSQYPELAKLPIADIPGLSNVPIAKIASVSAIGTANTRIVRVNKILTNQKDFNAKVVSGSDQKPLAKWDKGTPVSGVELLDSAMAGKNNLINGAVAIIGSSQMLPGGNVPSPLEPTGLAIPGTPFKLSFESPDAKKGSVRLQLNMRLEYAFGLRTSHFIPIPTGIEVTEKSKIALIPMEVPMPASIAMGGITNPASKATVASPIPTKAKSFLPDLPIDARTTTEAKAKALGSAVKSSTDPTTGKAL
jgi:hypothetical protein